MYSSESQAAAANEQFQTKEINTIFTLHIHLQQPISIVTLLIVVITHI